MRRILLPVTCETWAMPCESRKMTPICEGVRPFFASFVTCSRTSLGDVFSHDGGVRRYGSADFEMPLLRARESGEVSEVLSEGGWARRRVAAQAHPLLCIRPMAPRVAAASSAQGLAKEAAHGEQKKGERER